MITAATLASTLVAVPQLSLDIEFDPEGVRETLAAVENKTITTEQLQQYIPIMDEVLDYYRRCARLENLLGTVRPVQAPLTLAEAVVI